MDAKDDTNEIVKSNSKLITIAALLIGCGLFLLAHYALAEWAEASLYGHDLQHILIFAGGIFAGIAGLKLFTK